MKRSNFIPYHTLVLLLLGSLILAACFSGEEWQRRRAQKQWVDSVMNTLSLREKIGQLFSIRAHSNLGKEHQEEVEMLIEQYHVGGLTFFQGDPLTQAKLTNRYQKLAKLPLLIAIDGEWGLGMRLDKTMSFPRQMTLGAVQDDSLIYQMGESIGRHCQRVGVHVNFAPVVDVNNNPQNPVINDRSFGENKQEVSRRSILYMKGMQAQQVIACAKHFPGHGDTDQDSHYTLPVLTHSRERLEQLELAPFRALLDAGVMSVMTAHLKVPSLDKKMPASVSPIITQKLLRETLGFEGLVFTDALEMKGIDNGFADGEKEVLALLAGNDVLLLPGDVPKAVQAIEKAIQSKRLSLERIEQSVRRVLAAKYFAGLHQYQPVSLFNLENDLNQPQDQALREALFAEAITVVNNQKSLLPIARPDTLKIASLVLGTNQKNYFQATLDLYADVSHFQVQNPDNINEYQRIVNALKGYDLVLISLNNMRRSARLNYGITRGALGLIRQLQAQSHVALSVFGSPYSLKYFEKIPQLICAYEDHKTTQKLVPQVIFGALGSRGKLPVSASKQLLAERGIDLAAFGALQFRLPETVGMSSDSLSLIDDMFAQAIKDSLLPGGQLLIARKGAVVWHKPYGYHTYSQQTPVRWNSLYDIASLSKVVGTLPLTMKLYEAQKFQLNDLMAKHLPSLGQTNKAALRIDEVLCHQAGLQPYIPYYERTLLYGKPSVRFYKSHTAPNYQIPVAEHLFGLNSLEDSLWQWTLESEMREKPDSAENYDYEYSDLSFYLLKRLNEKLFGKAQEEVLRQQFIQPLGLRYLDYLPLARFPQNQIVPTEEDDYFRHQLVWGSVHDQGAAMLGGVGGHAGLFSNALDLGKFLQMFLQGGYYAGQRYFEKSTVQLFSQPRFADNRRGLGWDRPPVGKSFSYIADLASPESFGHSGFTGCVAWVDPAKDLVIVFLSNRIHPSVSYDKLIKEHFRRKVQNRIYRAIID